MPDMNVARLFKIRGQQWELGADRGPKLRLCAKWRFILAGSREGAVLLTGCGAQAFSIVHLSDSIRMLFSVVVLFCFLRLSKT